MLTQGEQFDTLPRSYSADSLEESGGRRMKKVQWEPTGTAPAPAAVPNPAISSAMPAPASTSDMAQDRLDAWLAMQAPHTATQRQVDAVSVQQQKVRAMLAQQQRDAPQQQPVQVAQAQAARQQLVQAALAQQQGDAAQQQRLQAQWVVEQAAEEPRADVQPRFEARLAAKKAQDLEDQAKKQVLDEWLQTVAGDFKVCILFMA